jgi:hypothetical protein
MDFLSLSGEALLPVFSEKGPHRPANPGREGIWYKPSVLDLQAKTQAA